MVQVSIGELKFYPGNARTGNVAIIAESLERLGQFRPIVVNKGTHAPQLANTVLAGNHTTKAAISLGWDSIDVHWVDVDTDTAARIVLVDNKANDAADYDNDALLDLLQSVGDLEGTGFTDDELEDLLSADDVEDASPAVEAPSTALLVECETPLAANKLRSELTQRGYVIGDV